MKKPMPIREFTVRYSVPVECCKSYEGPSDTRITVSFSADSWRYRKLLEKLYEAISQGADHFEYELEEGGSGDHDRFFAYRRM